MLKLVAFIPCLSWRLFFLSCSWSGTHTHSPNTLALTPFPSWIGSTCGIGLFLEGEDWSRPITHHDIFPSGVDMVVHIFLVNIHYHISVRNLHYWSWLAFSEFVNEVSWRDSGFLPGPIWPAEGSIRGSLLQCSILFQLIDRTFSPTCLLTTARCA